MQMDDESDTSPSDTSPSDSTENGNEGASEREGFGARVVAEVMGTREELVGRVLEMAARTDRGQAATKSQKAKMEDWIAQLEGLNPTEMPVDTDKINGQWNLVYSSVPFYKGNPFLALSAAPNLAVGQIRQVIFVDGGELRGEVDLKLFPEITGTMLTTCKVTPVSPDRLEIVVEKVTFRGGSILDKVDLGGISVDVPVERIFQQLRGTVPETFIDTSYLDDQYRISRGKSGAIYVFGRE